MVCIDCGTNPRLYPRSRCSSCNYKHNLTPERKEYQKRYHKEYRSKKKEELALKRLIYYKQNYEKIRKQKHLAMSTPAYKEYKRLYDVKYREKNKKRLALIYKNKCAKRRAIKKQAMPPWVDQEHVKKIYNNCPPGFHVDHIIPLQGDNVRGLHVPWNLQYLPAADNIRKGNRYEPGR